jgi:uncharacterized protein YdeI (YjbR/CyaY-like superfamily)
VAALRLAIAAVKALGSGAMAETRPVEVPAELASALSEDAVARAYFDSLPPSHRREYVGYMTEAKKPETRKRRVERTIAMLRERAAGND